jgi:hypothetical protein
VDESDLKDLSFGFLSAYILGEAFLNKAFRLRTNFAARMLRPYKNRDSYPEITKEGLI